MKKPQSLQTSLFRNLAAGPILLGVTLFAISLFTTRYVRKSFAAELTGRIIAETETAFVEYMRPVQEMIDLSLHLGVSGKLEAGRPEELDSVITAFLDTVHQVSSIHVADTSGEAYMLLRKPDGSYYNRLASPSGQGSPGVRVREWTKGGKPPVPTEVDLEYDPRDRDWFEEALAKREAVPESGDPKKPVWSDPYVFLTTKDPGITASVAYQTPSGKTQVLAFDILLSDIIEFARNSLPQNSGLVFILLRHPGKNDLDVLALPSEELTGSQKFELSDFPIPVEQLSGASRLFVDTAFGKKRPEQNKPFRFQADGVPQWGATALSPLSDEMEIWIVAMIPESEILRGIPNASIIILAVLLATVGVMLLRARKLAQRYGEPIGELVAQTERIGRLNFKRETTIESPIHEVQALASSQDAMRRSLSALSAMNDREAIARELRALPKEMQQRSAGPWSISLWTGDSPSGGGCFPMLFSVSRDAEGRWVLASDRDDETGFLVILVSTHLDGMRAAQYAPALRATIRSLLRISTRPENLIESIREELREGAMSTAGISIVAAHLDVTSQVVEVVGYSPVSILHRKTGAETNDWCDDCLSGENETLVRGTMELDGTDFVVLMSPTIFDVLNSERRRLSRSDIEASLVAFDGSSAAETASGLGKEISEFSGDDSLNVDVALFVIAPSAPHDNEC